MTSIYPAHDCLEVEESVDCVVHEITKVGRHVIEDECEGYNYIIMYILYHLCRHSQYVIYI